MTVGFSSAPQSAARWLYEGAGLGTLPKRELALPVDTIGGSGLHIWEDQRLLWLVEQTFP